MGKSRARYGRQDPGSDRSTGTARTEAGRANIALSMFTVTSALATVVLFVWLAKYYVDHHAATQGAAIIGALAAVVTAFIGGRALSAKRDGDEKPASPQGEA